MTIPSRYHHRGHGKPGQVLRVPAYGLGSFQIHPGDAEGLVCQAPECRQPAGQRVAYLYRGDLLTMDLCEPCALTADRITAGVVAGSTSTDYSDVTRW